MNMELCNSCGEMKKHNDNVITPQWIADTVNLMNKMMDEKRKQNSKCVNDNGNAMKNRTSQASHDKKVKVCDDTQQSIKYSVIETNNSNCTASTQTIEHAITISDTSNPHLINILSEIQQYAKNIENYFQVIQESIKRTKSPDVQTQIERRRTFSTTHSGTDRVLGPPSGTTIPRELQEKVDTSLSSLESITRSLGDITMIENAAVTSTPRKNEIDNHRSRANLPAPPNLTDIDSIRSFSDDDPMQQEFADEELADDMSYTDSTKYLQLPRRSEVSFQTERKSGGANGHTTVPENVREQIDDVYANMEEIQRKINRLRQDVVEDDHFNRDRKRKTL